MFNREIRPGAATVAALVIATLTGCATAKRAASGVSSALESLTAPPAGLDGSYRLTRFQGAALPLRRSPTGIPESACGAKGTPQSFEITEGTLTLTRGLGASIRTTAAIGCRGASGEVASVSVPQDLDGSFAVDGQRVDLHMAGQPPIQLAWDRQNGILTAPALGAEWRASVTGHGGSSPSVEKGHALPAIAATGQAAIVSSGAAPDTGRIGSTPAALRTLWLYTTEVTRVVSLDEPYSAGKAPFANPADSLTLAAREWAVPVRVKVLSRTRLRVDDPATCGNTKITVWRYRLPLPGSVKPADAGIVVMRQHFRPTPGRALPEAARKRMEEEYLRDMQAAQRQVAQGNLQGVRELREKFKDMPAYADMADPDTTVTDSLMDYQRESVANAIPVDGPDGAQLWFLSLSMNDDPSDHGLESSMTYLLDGTGRVLIRRRGAYAGPVAGDMNGDGISEIPLADGAIRWDGRSWVFPPAAQPRAGGCD